MDLLTADLQALAVYGSYFYSMSKTWSRPLPEIYDAEVVSNYFNCRPHIIAFRLLEVSNVDLIYADKQEGVPNTALWHYKILLT